MQNSQVNTTLPTRHFKLLWLYKYSDNLANIFGGIMILALGYIIFSLIVAILPGYSQKITSDFPRFYDLAVISAFIVLPALLLTLHFSNQVLVIEKASESDRHQNSAYIISDWRLATLRAVGVPGDIVGYLKKLLKDSQTGELKTVMQARVPEDWLSKLTSDLGETRVNEFEEIILKYTRREEPTAAKPAAE